MVAAEEAPVEEEPAAPAQEEPAVPGLPKVSKTSLTVGNYVVPISVESLVDAQGKVQVTPLVDLSKTPDQHHGYWTYKWLWRPLGISYDQWNNGYHFRLPLMQEIKETLHGLRGKRNRLRQWGDAEQCPQPTFVQIQIRGRSLDACADARRPRLNITSLADMKWFLAELLKDVNAGPGALLPIAADPEAAPGEAPPIAAVPEGAAAAGPQAADVAPGGVAPPPVATPRTESALAQAIEDARRQLRAAPGVSSATWVPAQGRFRLRPAAKGVKPKYASVKNFHQLNKRRREAQNPEEEDEALETIKDAIGDAVVAGLAKV